MPVKKKSIAVSIASGIVIGAVLLLTLIAYAVYVEFKYRDERSRYLASLEKIGGKVTTRAGMSAHIK